MFIHSVLWQWQTQKLTAGHREAIVTTHEAGILVKDEGTGIQDQKRKVLEGKSHKPSSYLFICVFVGTRVYHVTCGCRRTVYETILSFRHMGFGNQIQVIRLGGKHLFPTETSHCP